MFKFAKQKEKYGKRHQKPKKDRQKEVIPASEFEFDAVLATCRCPEGNLLMFCEGRLSQCSTCSQKHQCMRNPSSADHCKGSVWQVSFTTRNNPNYTDWMKQRVDSAEGKRIYSHRMSVVEPVFGNITSSKRLNRFSLRRKTKVTTQWRMFCIIHNIEKLKNYSSLGV